MPAGAQLMAAFRREPWVHISTWRRKEGRPCPKPAVTAFDATSSQGCPRTSWGRRDLTMVVLQGGGGLEATTRPLDPEMSSSLFQMTAAVGMPCLHPPG